MADRPRKTEDEPDKPTFYVDTSLGLKTVPEMLRAAGYEVKTYADLGLPHDAPDTQWIRLVAEKGWVALLKDDRIRRKPDEQEAYRGSPSMMFVFTSANASGQQQADAFRKALSKIVLRSQQYRRPALFTIDRAANLEQEEGEKRGGKKKKS